MTLSFGAARARGLLSSEAEALLPRRYRSPDQRRATVERASGRPLTAAVRAAIRSDSAALPASAARRRALAALDAEDVSFVVTGQQLGLFLSPAYSLWKAATAIALAQRLSDEHGRPVLPLFWLQSEDHDLAEIASCTLVDSRGGVHTAAVTTEDGAERSAIAHRALLPDVEQALEHASNVLATLPDGGDAVLHVLRDAWRPGRGWVEAFSRTLGAAFAEHPLLVLQPRTQALAEASLGVHRRALAEHAELAALLEARDDALSGAGFSSQVPPRSDCALSFFHPDGPEGPRFRLRRRAEGWCLADGSDREVSADVERALEESPLSFSSSALLRPLIQDTLLPTAAYVGGPGEVSYWAQLPPLYERFGLPLPLVVPRATGVLVDAEARQALEALCLRPDQIDCDVAALLERLGPPPNAPSFDALPTDARAALEAALAPARDRAAELDEQLLRAFDKAADNVEREVSKLRQRLERAALRADEPRLAAARRAVARLRPGGTPQDRALSWPDLAARVGAERLASLLVAAADEAIARDTIGQAQEVAA